MGLTKLRICTQVLSYRQQQVGRTAILRYIKKQMKNKWNRSVIALIDYVIKHKALPPENPKSVLERNKVVADLTKELSLVKKGRFWVWSAKFVSLSSAKNKAKILNKKLVRAGFRFDRTCGDVGFWTDGYVYRKVKNVDLTAGVCINERCRPYVVKIEIGSVRDYYAR